MNALLKQFVPYHIALTLRELGFNEACFATDDIGAKVGIIDLPQFKVEGFMTIRNAELQDGTGVASPLYQQVFEWLDSQNIIMHDYWIFNVGKYGCNVIDKMNGKLLWPQRSLQAELSEKEKQSYLHHAKIDAWNEAIKEALKLLKNG